MPDSEIAKLSDDEKSQRLKIHDALEEKKFASTDVVDEFVENVKGSLLFQLSWDEVLSAAPLSINLIGACYIACSVSSATAVKLPVRTSEPYKYLPYVLLDLNNRHIIKLFQKHIATIMYDRYGRHGPECISEDGSENEPYYVRYCQKK